jgi:signal transduction histidine kinase
MKVLLLTPVLLAIALAVGAQGSQKRVLVVHANRSAAPVPIVMDREYQRLIGTALDGHLDYHSEYLDVARFGDAAYLTALRDFLAFKYRDQRFDLIIATTGAAADFVTANHDVVFGGAPVLCVLAPSLSPGPNATGVIVGMDLAGTIALALQVQPATREVFVVSGASEFDKYYEDVARNQLRQFEDRVGLTYLSGLPMSELEQRVSDLPADSIVYFLSVVEDGAAVKFLPLDSLQRISRVANAPIYSWLDATIDHGIVGGSLASADLLAERTAPVALRVLKGEAPSSIPVETIDMNVPQVDWRQLQKWGISEDRLPAGTLVRFRQPGMWEQYKVYIVGAASLMVIQMALISTLFVQLARRRKAEQERADLAARLISAQEAERAHIARELHDDFGQRIASFSIAMSGLKRRLTDVPAVQAELADMYENTMTLSKDLRLLSHELHPGIIQQLGLIDAVRTRCDEVSVEHGITVNVNVPPDLGRVPDDAALCLYRVLQESLQNVARHSDARSAQVSVVRSDGHVSLRVQDDGRGFDPGAAAKRRGIGLVSLDERVRALGGTFAIDSKGGAGTTVSVTLPV